jgi:hypothetical protein
MDDTPPSGRGRPWPSHLFELDAAEQLLLNGIRHWIAGWVHMSPEPWEQAWAAFSRQLGRHRSREAVAALAGLVDTLRGNVRRSFHYHQPCCPCIGADEICLVLMAGAAQRGEHTRVEAMARWLVHERAVDEIGRHAKAIGEILARGGLALPHRAAVSAEAESGPQRITLH